MVAVEHRQQVVGHGDQLGVGLARVVGAHDLAQHVVPLDQPPQRGGQPGGVDGLVELQLQRDVVRGGPRVVAGEEPQPALRRVQRHPVADGAAGPPLGLGRAPAGRLGAPGGEQLPEVGVAVGPVGSVVTASPSTGAVLSVVTRRSPAAVRR